MKLKKWCILVLLLFVSLIAAAEEESDSGIKPDFGLAGFGFFNAGGYAGITGFDIVPGVDSSIRLYLFGGRYGDGYFRDTDGNQRVDESLGFSSSPLSYWRISGMAGLDLGILYSDELEKNWLYSQFYLVSDCHWHDKDPLYPSVLSQTNLPDRNGFWINSLFFSLVLDRVNSDNLRKISSGIGAELSLEWTPSFLFNQVYGDADFLRLNGKFTAYIPVLAHDAVSIYFAERAIYDYLAGDSINSYSQRTTGGFSKEPAMGGGIRGVLDFRFDANIKMLNNLDVRITFPSLFGYAVVPELFAFFDMGLMDDIDYQLCPPEEGLYTAGAGIYIDLYIFNFRFDVGYYFSYSFTEDYWYMFNYEIGSHLF